MRASAKHVVIGSKDIDGRTFSQSGPWDRILCVQHERAFQVYEDYAIDFIRSFALQPAERVAGIFQRQGVGHGALIRFVCAVFWRFHSSTRVEAEGVWLPDWEADLRAVAFNGELSRAPQVIIGAHLQTLYPPNRYAYPPHRSSFDERHVWQFVVHGVIFMAKLDRQPFSPAVDAVTLRLGVPLVGLVKPASQDEFEGVRQMLIRMGTPRPLTKRT